MTSSDSERRAALQRERGELLRRIADWTVRADKVPEAKAGDYVVPLFAGCGVGVPLFGALAIYIVKSNEEAPSVTPLQTTIASLVIFVVVAFVVYGYRRRAQNAQLAETRRAQAMAVGMLQVRLREIDDSLRKMGQG